MQGKPSPVVHMGSTSLLHGISANFLGHAPLWYKYIILGTLIINPIILAIFGKFLFGWILIVQFISVLAFSLKCHPLPAGGILVLQAIVLGMAGEDTSRLLMNEVSSNLPVLLLLLFMLPAVAMMKELLVYIFTKILVRVKNKTLLSFLFLMVGAILSAWLDALTVTAVIITISIGFYHIYHAYASTHGQDKRVHDVNVDHYIAEVHREDLEQFRAFLRSIVMHGAVGTAIGGVLTLVGEPQNIIIGNKMGWDFREFFLVMSPVTIPAFIGGICTCLFVERFKLFGYGVLLPDRVRQLMQEHELSEAKKTTPNEKARLLIQFFAAICLVVGLATHVVEVGFVGLAVFLFLAVMNGVTEEHRLNHAFAESMAFTTIVVVFLVLVTIIHSQHLFVPVIDFVLMQEGRAQLMWMYVANGLLSVVSDNVFVALTYITQLKEFCDSGQITAGDCKNLAVAINTGTNLPSVGTPNGQAAFLFLLMSSLAMLIRLSYWRMCVMAFPYTVVLSLVGFVGIMIFL